MKNSPFGMGMPGRGFNAGNYRYGFNGKEKANEIYGDGNAYDFEARILDVRLGGRWLSVDPLTGKFPWQTPYIAMDGNPILKIDPTGKSASPPSTEVKENSNGSYTVFSAKPDKDNNIYTVDNKGTRTGKVIGQTENPWDFVRPSDKYGTFKDRVPVTFDLKKLPNGDEIVANATASWEASAKFLPKDGALVALAYLSRNKGVLDIKNDFPISQGGEFTAVSYNGKITTARTIGNIAFGKNMRAINQNSWGTKLTALKFYEIVMPVVGAYNQANSDGNGYNPGFPFYGEHTYSGTSIYQGYFGKKP